MTDAVRAQFNAALEATNGDREETAKRMGWPVLKVVKLLKLDHDLRTRWTTPVNKLATPTEATTVSRKEIRDVKVELRGPGAEEVQKLNGDKEAVVPKAVVVSEADSLLAEQIMSEDAAVRKGLELMGLNLKEMDEAVAIQAFHRDFFKNSLELIGGGVTRNSIKLRTELTNIESRLEKVRTRIDSFGDRQNPEREQWVNEEKILMKAHSQAGAQLTRIFDISMKGAYVMALIRTSKKTLKMAKPGFTHDV